MTKNDKEGKYNFDIYGLDERFSGFEKRIDDSDMLPENKELAISFKRKVYASGLMGKQRILKYEVFFRNFDSILRKAFNKAKRGDLERVVTYIKDRGDWKESTKNDFQRLLKRYYKIASGMEKERDPPEIVKWIEIEREKEPPINWDDVPHWEDIIKMSNFTYCLRDRALVKSMWEAGSRIGEHLSLRVGDVEDVEHGVYLNFQRSKSPELRKVFIKLSAPDILEWLSLHPLKNDKTAPLFCKVNGKEYNKVVGHRYVYKILNKIREKAGISKVVSPHKLRHGSASYFSDFLSDSDMDMKFGWAYGSTTKRKYQHKNYKSIEDKIQRLAGEGEKAQTNIYEKDEKKIIECYYCKKSNDAERKICFNCRRILDINVAEKIQRLKERSDNISVIYLEENPEALKGFIDYLSKKAEGYMVKEKDKSSYPSP